MTAMTATLDRPDNQQAPHRLTMAHPGQIQEALAAFSAQRAHDAAQQVGKYTIVAFDPDNLYIFLANPGGITRCVSWTTLRCNCPDATEHVKALEREAREAGMKDEYEGDLRIWCEHVNLVTEVISRKLRRIGRYLTEFRDEIEALPIAFPNLPVRPPHVESAAFTGDRAKRR